MGSKRHYLHTDPSFGMLTAPDSVDMWAMNQPEHNLLLTVAELAVVLLHLLLSKHVCCHTGILFHIGCWL